MHEMHGFCPETTTLILPGAADSRNRVVHRLVGN